MKIIQCFLIAVSTILLFTGCSSIEEANILGGQRCPLDCEIWSADENTCLKWIKTDSGACNKPFEVSAVCGTEHGSCPTIRQQVVGSSCSCHLYVENRVQRVYGQVEK